MLGVQHLHTYSSDLDLRRAWLILTEAKEALGHWGGFEDVVDEWRVLPERFRKGGGFYLLHSDNTLIGGCAAYEQSASDEATLRYLYVRKGLRGSGSGRTLLKWLIQDAEGDGYRWMVATLNRQSLHAQQLLMDLGFAIVHGSEREFIFERSLTPRQAFEKPKPPILEGRDKPSWQSAVAELPNA